MITNIDTHSIASKPLCAIVFRTNSDDYNTLQIRQITKYAKGLGYTVKKSRTYSQTKLMSTCKFTITTPNLVTWEENKPLALDIINSALNLK